MSYKKLYFDFLSKNLNEYVTSDYSLNDESIINRIPDNCRACQNFLGEYSAVSGIYGSHDALMNFSSLYAKFDIEDEILDEILADFLNLHNGLVAVELSNTQQAECSLTVPAMPPDENTHLYKSTYSLCISFSFGDINFFISEP